MSSRYGIILDTKNLRRVAFTVGFGLTLGKMTGDLVSSALDGFARGTLKIIAGKGNETAQSICKEAGYCLDFFVTPDGNLYLRTN